MDKYSVLMSVYRKDHPDYLKASIDSMLAQTYPCDQFVLVKDGPVPEELERIITRYEAENPQLFTVVALPRNMGLGRALDIGLEHCRNELVARMDSDDISLPERCRIQVECFEKDPGLDIVGTYINEFFDDPQNIQSSRIVPEKHEDIVAFARRRSPFNHPTVMYKKNAVVRCGGYGTTQRKEDLCLFPAMVNSGCKAMNIPQALLLYRSNADNLKRRKNWINCKEYIQVIYGNYKKGYSGLFDLAYVVAAQLTFFVLPTGAAKALSNKVLRKSPVK